MREHATTLAWPAVAMLALVALVMPARAQVSPGPLSRAHSSLEGNLQCQKCHGKEKGDMDRKCLACHGEIAWEVSNARGFHGREAKSRCALRICASLLVAKAMAVLMFGSWIIFSSER